MKSQWTGQVLQSGDKGAKASRYKLVITARLNGAKGGRLADTPPFSLLAHPPPPPVSQSSPCSKA